MSTVNGTRTRDAQGRFLPILTPAARKRAVVQAAAARQATQPLATMLAPEPAPAYTWPTQCRCCGETLPQGLRPLEICGRCLQQAAAPVMTVPGARYGSQS